MRDPADDRTPRAFVQLGAEFERIATEAGDRESPGRRGASGRRRLFVAAGAVALGAALAVLLAVDGLVGEDSRKEARAAPALRFPDGKTVDLDEFFARNGDPGALKRRLAAYGIELEIRVRPVHPSAAGRVFSLESPPNARWDERHRLVIERGLDGPIIVTVGRAVSEAEAATTTEGLTIYEVFPELCEAIDPLDPLATEQALTARGFQVDWQLMKDNPKWRPPKGPPWKVDPYPVPPSPTIAKEVKSPPRGTQIISVLGPNGDYTSVSRSTKRLLIEISPPGAKLGSLSGAPHGPANPDAECADIKGRP